MRVVLIRNIQEIEIMKFLRALLSLHILITKKIQFLKVRISLKLTKMKIYFKKNTKFLKTNKRFVGVLKL